MSATALTLLLLLAGDPNEWNTLDGKKGKPLKAAPASKTAPAAAPAFPEGARAPYQDAVAKVASGQYGPATDVLNALAPDYPRLPELFATRCSAQLGLRHAAAAEAPSEEMAQLREQMAELEKTVRQQQVMIDELNKG